MFGFGKKKEKLLREEELMKVRLEKAKINAAKAAEYQKIRERIGRKKAAIRALEKYKNGESLYQRIRSKTSPVLRGIENKVREHGPGIAKSLGKISERSMEMGAALSGANQPKSKKKKDYPRIW